MFKVFGFCEEIIIVDDYSSDKTVEIVHKIFDGRSVSDPFIKFLKEN